MTFAGRHSRLVWAQLPGRGGGRSQEVLRSPGDQEGHAGTKVREEVTGSGSWEEAAALDGGSH